MGNAWRKKRSDRHKPAFPITGSSSEPVLNEPYHIDPFPGGTSSCLDVNQSANYNLKTGSHFMSKLRKHVPIIRNINKIKWQFEVVTNNKKSKWQNFPESECDNIESQFCNPEVSVCTLHNTDDIVDHIDFQTMTMIDKDGTCTSVRRLDTYHKTEWLWYWNDNSDVWVEYIQTEASSKDIEKRYCKDSNSVIAFNTSDHSYEINFNTMKQKNLKYSTERNIRRRPRFTPNKTSSDVDKSNSTPNNWKSLNYGNKDYRLVEIKTGSEFSSIKSKILETMSVRIKKVERIQNPELWDAYYRKRTWMQKRRNVNEKILFHGTKSDYIEAICSQGFDWRVSGMSSGTNYGKGAYFARDASYSKNYTNSNQLFVARVLVGECAKGESNFVRPPPKNRRRPFSKMYDSCVNTLSDPNVFVIFKAEQSYPEYLVEYIEE